MRVGTKLISLVAALSLGVGGVGCGGDTASLGREDAAVTPDVPRVTWVDVPRTDTGPITLDVPRNLNPVVVGVVPDHGPFNGRDVVTVRGANFDGDSVTVRFAGNLVQPSATTVEDSRRINVVPPSGRPGSVDVAVEIDGRRAVLPNGYHYDSFYVDPADGSPAGGTLVTLRGLGTHFDATTQVTFDGLPCTEVNAVGPDELTCVTPAHPEAQVTVAVQTGSERISVDDAFNFSDGDEGSRGGLGGGEINGSLSVTVLAGNTGDPIPNALVYLGSDPLVAPPRSARTNDRGRATLSFPELHGPQTLTLAARCFNAHTVQLFDARNVTLYLYAQQTPACAMGSPGDNTPGRGAFGARVSGELVWDGPNEFAPNPWRNIPEPRRGERRVAFVYASQDNISSGTVAPGDGNTVLEVVTPGYGGRGYPFSISTRPAALAIYAIAGIEVIQTQQFTPYIMGVARGVLGSPQAMITGVVVPMNITLDHQTQVVVSGLPSTVNGQPDRVRVEGFIDLGGEGVIARSDITAWGRDEADEYYLDALPAFTGALADGRLIVRAVYGTGDWLGAPSSTMVAAGITSPDDPVRLGNWVGIPEVTTPADNGRLGADRAVRWEQRGNDPDMWWMSLSGDVLYWYTYAPGSARSAVFPDLSGVMGLSDLPQGQVLYMNLNGFRAPGFDYNEFRYRFLSQLYWTAYSTRTVLWSR